jgi:hypothetical protein
VAQFEVGELAARSAGRGVGGERGEPLVANAVSRCPSASVSRSWAPGWGRSLRTVTRMPGGQPDRSSSGHLEYPGTVPGLPVGAVSRLPVTFGDEGEFVDDVFGQGESDRVRQPLAGDPLQQLVGAPG